MKRPESFVTLSEKILLNSWAILLQNVAIKWHSKKQWMYVPKHNLHLMQRGEVWLYIVSRMNGVMWDLWSILYWVSLIRVEDIHKSVHMQCYIYAEAVERTLYTSQISLMPFLCQLSNMLLSIPEANSSFLVTDINAFSQKCFVMSHQTKCLLLRSWIQKCWFEMFSQSDY